MFDVLLFPDTYYLDQGRMCPPRGRAQRLPGCVFCCPSVSQWCLTLRDPMDGSMLSFPVAHYLLEFVHTHVL